MLLFNTLLLSLSALPTSLAKDPRHHLPHSTLPTSSSTFTTHRTSSASNATTPLTTTSSHGGSSTGGSACPTVTKTVAKTVGICPDIRCLPVLVDGTTPVATSTFAVGCGCPVATPTETLSQCDTGCERLTRWVYKTAAAGGC